MKDKLDKKIEKIKVSRMKPEEKYIYDIVKNLKQYISCEYPEYIFYKNKINNKLTFVYNKNDKRFWFDDIIIWIYIETRFRVDYNQIEYLVENMVCKPLQLNNVKLNCQSMYTFNNMWNDTFILKNSEK